jgi:LysM repeat protein
MVTINNTRQWISQYQRWLSESESLNNAQLVADHFSGRWSDNAIAAMCGNMRHESSINPDMYEYGYDWTDNRGYGLVQWTPRTKYWDWAVARGLDPRNGNSQLARIDYEQENAIQWIRTAEYPLSFNEFTQSALSVDYLTEAFTWNYERPNRQAGENSMPARKAFALRVYQEIDFGGGGVTPTPSKGGSTTLQPTQYQYEKEKEVNGMTYYQVKAGDTLSAIANRHNVPMDSIKRVKYEDIANVNRIERNEILLLPKVVKPTQKTHTVKAGENLSVIARNFNTTVARLASTNNIKDVNKIRVGQVLKV